MTEEAITVVVGNATSSATYSLIPLLLSGDTFGQDKRVQLILLDATSDVQQLRGVAMEIEDCCFPLLKGVQCALRWEGGLWGAGLVVLPGCDTPPGGEDPCSFLPLLQPLASALENSPQPPRVVLVGRDVEVATYTLHLLAASIPASSILGLPDRQGRGMAKAAAVSRRLSIWWRGGIDTSPENHNYPEEEELSMVVYWGKEGRRSGGIYYDLPVTVVSPCQVTVRTEVTDSPQWQTAEADRLSLVLSRCAQVKSALTDTDTSADAVSLYARL